MSETAEVSRANVRVPRTVPELQIGPGLWDGSRRRYTLHDPRTGWYFRVGEHEHFVVTRLDGERTIGEVEEDFATAFSRRLTPRHWESLFALLGSRALLKGSDTPALLDRLRDARQIQVSEARTLVHARFPLIHADSLLANLAPAARRLNTPVAWTLVWVATSALSIYLVLGFEQLMATSVQAWRHPATAIVVIVFLWGMVALHELGHGVVAWLHGARDIRIGLMWRLPALVPYCQVDDISLFNDRRHRVATALAGPTVSVALCLPFAAVHMLTGGSGPIGIVSTAVTTFGLIAGLVNLVPLFRMDGYFALTNALDVEDLERSSRAHLVALVRGRRDAPAGPRDGAYLAYGVGSLLALTAIVVAICAVVVHVLSEVLPVAMALTIALTVVAVTFIVGIIMTRRARSKLALLSGTKLTQSSKWGNL